MGIKNLFAGFPSASNQEDILTLAQTGEVRIERIISNGQCSPPDFWYDQPQSEWVLLIQGTAILQFEDNPSLPLKAGDYLLIPAHTKHRVEETSAEAVWLAVHYTP